MPPSPLLITGTTGTATRTWRERLAAEVAPRQLPGSLAAALILYLLVGIMTLSIAAMVYAGPLVELLPEAMSGWPSARQESVKLS